MGTDETTKGNNNSSLEKKYEYDNDTWTDFIWNGRTGQFFGRTGASWIKIFVFYVIFYFALGTFAWLCYYLFASMSLKENEPRWILEESIIGTNPGVGFRPMPDQEENSGSSLIWYRRDNTLNHVADASIWYEQLTNYTDAVENPAHVESLQTCSYENGRRATRQRSCRVDMREFGSACTKKNNFGYTTGEPCILIKLNRIFGWKPQPFGIDENGNYDPELLIKDLDGREEMPGTLKEFIENGVSRTRNPASFLDTVWISCTGENIGDQETIGSVQYFPQPGIPGYFFPYYNQVGYQSPFIFVQLLNPQFTTLINVECRAWARNVIYDKMNRLGSVHFEIMID